MSHGHLDILTWMLPCHRCVLWVAMVKWGGHLDFLNALLKALSLSRDHILALHLAAHRP